MLTRMFSVVAITATLAAGFVACNSDNNPLPAAPAMDFSAQNASNVGQDEDTGMDEIYDEVEPGARAAAMIDTANQVKFKINVTSACVTSGSAGVGFKYVEGQGSTGILSTTALTTALGAKSFSIPQAKLNTVVLKTFDKTKSYTVYILKTARVPSVPKTLTSPSIPAKPATYAFVTTLNGSAAAEKAMNKAGTKRIGRPITVATYSLACPQ